MLAKRVKEAAQPHLRALAEEAGFRLARDGKDSYHCPCLNHKSRDKHSSASLYGDRFYCHASNQSWDAIDLAQRIVGGTTGDGIRWLAARYGITQKCTSARRPQFSEADSRNAELFRVGFCWQLERYLDLLKQAWALDDSFADGGRISSFTRLLSRAQRWTPNQAVMLYLRFRRARPRFVAACVEEAEQSRLQLATAIAHASRRAA
jgi:hypothetical protein